MLCGVRPGPALPAWEPRPHNVQGGWVGGAKEGVGLPAEAPPQGGSLALSHTGFAVLGGSSGRLRD